MNTDSRFGLETYIDGWNKSDFPLPICGEIGNKTQNLNWFLIISISILKQQKQK
jgi:hypothetical protein